MNKFNCILMCLLILIISFPSSFALPVSEVTLTGYVNDYTNSINSDDLQVLEELASSLNNAGVAQVAIVIVDSLDGLSKEEYALKIAHENLGDTQKDNGLLLLVAMQEREYRIEVGYGLEGVLNDAKVGRIARETLVPNFKENDYGWGLIQFLANIHLELLPEQEETIPQQYVDTKKNSDGIISYIFGIFAMALIFFFNFLPIIVIFLIIRFFISLARKGNITSNKRSNDDSMKSAILISSMFRGGKGGFGGGSSGGSFGGGGFGGGGAGGGW